MKKIALFLVFVFLPFSAEASFFPSSTNNGTSDASTPRVTIASDSTGQVKLAAGVAEIGNVKNAGTFATQSAITAALNAIADGADVTLGAKADAKSTATDTTAVTIMSVMKEISAMEQAPASRAVTNAGTFATQSAITAASGSISSGAVSSGAFASGSIASGALASGSIAAGAIANGATSIAENEDVASADADRGVKTLAIQKATPADTAGTDGDYAMPQMSAGRLWTTANIDKMNGVAVSMGSGIMGTGVQRVAIASDNDAITVKQATGTNLHAVLDANSGVDIGKLTANQSVNVAQINAVTPLMGAGATGTGAQRVTVSDGFGKTIVNVSGTTSSSGDHTIVAADASNKIKVFAYSITTTSTTENLAKWTSGAGGTEVWRTDLQSPSGVVTGANMVLPPPAYFFGTTATNTALVLNTSAAVAVHYSIAYFVDAT